MNIKQIILSLCLVSSSVVAMEKPEPKFIKVFEEGTQNFVWIPSTLLELALGETFLKMDDYKKGAISLPFSKEVLEILVPSLELVSIIKKSTLAVPDIEKIYRQILHNNKIFISDNLDLQVQALLLMHYLNAPNIMLAVWIEQIVRTSKGEEIDLSAVALPDEIKDEINYQIGYRYPPKDSLISYLKLYPSMFDIRVTPKGELNNDFHIELRVFYSTQVTNNFGLKITLQKEIDRQVNKLKEDFKKNKINFTYSLYLHCNFTSLEENSFPYIDKLLKVDLRYNKLTTVAKNIFKGANNLEEINFWNNDLAELPELSYCPNLKEIDFGGNTIENLPKDFLCIQKNIMQVYLRKNKISSLPACFLSQADPTKIKLIDFSNNKLQTLPRELLERFISFAQKKTEIDLIDNELSIAILEKIPENLTEFNQGRGRILIDKYELPPAIKKQKARDND